MGSDKAMKQSPSNTPLEASDSSPRSPDEGSNRGNSKPLPFEFRAFEICLESVCRSLESEVEFVESAIKGTRNVLNACLKAKVKKVVVSSVVAVMVNPNCPKDQPMDENCWSDLEFCKQLEFEITFELKTARQYATAEGGQDLYMRVLASDLGRIC
ncbi:Cinnamoyl-CoA reductase 1 [Camellia lanceoleosa]|uniref:Cinnamoyl-CoA reductase 1 n=1 Tax=Camellia lanceoleosa TaxID=1840588 RepID=A0ACC0GP92_9ERIC|nr:Cinnamoyl-CoA reductase 1 [Camellia lanceoleosa]